MTSASGSRQCGTVLPPEENISADPSQIRQDGRGEKPSSGSEAVQDVRQSYLPRKSVAFWAIIISLCTAGLMTALEATITSTALPTIIEALGGADLYIWVVNIFFLTM